MQIYNFFSNFARICRIFYIKAVSEGNLLFWAASAWAVAYCVVQRTISNHPYMRLHIDKWKENGASTREIVLMEFLRKNI